jgi:hypothetical protein
MDIEQYEQHLKRVLNKRAHLLGFGLAFHLAILVICGWKHDWVTFTALMGSFIFSMFGLRNTKLGT